VYQKGANGLSALIAMQPSQVKTIETSSSPAFSAAWNFMS
jgi:hypothetical protein